MQTEYKIRTMLAEIGGVLPDVPSGADLYLELGVVSIQALELLTALEEHFGVAIPDEDFVEATSITRLTEMIDSLVKDRRKDSTDA
jgi:acyl carrier protein